MSLHIPWQELAIPFTTSPVVYQVHLNSIILYPICSVFSDHYVHYDEEQKVIYTDGETCGFVLP